MRARRSRLLLAVSAACLAAAVTLPAQAPVGAPQDEIVTAPIEADGVVHFRLRRVTSFPAEQRAAIIRDRIVSVANVPAISVDSIGSVEGDGATRILVGEQVITVVLEADANLEHTYKLVRVAAVMFALVVGYPYIPGLQSDAPTSTGTSWMCSPNTASRS